MAISSMNHSLRKEGIELLGQLRRNGRFRSHFSYDNYDDNDDDIIDILIILIFMPLNRMFLFMKAD